MKKDVKMMIISEYHPDSVFSTTKTASDAMKGAFEYIKYDKPDLIIVDDPSSNILYPEIFAGDCFLYDPVKSFMDKQLDIYQEFVQNLRKSSPTSEIYVTLTDASWYNIRRLTKRMVLREVNSNKKLLDDKEKEISKIDKEIKKLKEKGGDKKELMRLYGKKGGLMRSLNVLGDTLMVRMPRRESPEYTKGKKETTKRYIDELSKRSPPRTHIIPELLDVEVGDNSIKYSHNYEKLSQTPKLHGFKHTLDELNKEYIQSYEPTDFVLMSGHHGITVNHPFRHDKKDEYSLVASAMVMEDQEMVREVASGKFREDILQEKYGNLEAVKRFTKAYPSPGVMSVGRIDGCFFVNTYSMDHLARVGTGDIDIKEIEYEYVPFLSDIHLGKGASRVDLLENALKRIEKKKPNLMVNTGETFQGKNYPTMPVETPRPNVKDFERKLEEIKDIDELKKYVNNLYESQNEPVLDNQIRMFDYYLAPLVLDILVRTPYDVGYIITEPTHLYHTVGEHGLTEIGLQARPFEAIEESLKFLEEKGLIELKDERLKNIKDKIKGFNDDGCGYGKIENLRIGDNFYTLSAEHKPGSSTPSSDIPILGMIRRQAMNDVTDIKFEGHLHVGYTGVIPKKDNSISLHLKGMTFNEYDSYGKMRGWSPATVGYIELEVPKTKGSKGAYKITYVTSENLV